MKLQTMKMLIAVSVIFFATGCSDDHFETAQQRQSSPTQPNQRSIQVKKITEVIMPGSIGSDTTVSDFIYEGNKLTGIHTVYDGTLVYDSEITYSGSKVVSMNSFRNGVPRNTTTFYYTGVLIDKTVTNILGDFPDVYNNEYTYSNGNISLIKTYRMVDGNLQLDSTEQYVYQSGNVIERTRTSTIISPGTVYYTYDNLKNPFSGMNKYLQQILETENITGLNANNAITRSHYSSGNPDLITQTYTIEYNQNGYPTNIKKFSDTNTLMCDTTIEYR